MPWVVTPPSRTRLYRPGWTPDPAAKPPPAPLTGWIAIQSGFQSVTGALSGGGALTAELMPRPFVPGELSGDGALTALRIKRDFVYPQLAGAGTLASTYTLLQRSLAAFSSAGLLEGELIPQVADPLFEGGGFLQGLLDGLTASVVIGTGAAPTFGGEGTLYGSYFGVVVLGADFSGPGALSATFFPGSVFPDVTGDGALSATIRIIEAFPQFTGSGALYGYEDGLTATAVKVV